MQTRIPLPTDNIYKFYALFGLLVFISSMVLFVTTYTTFQSRSVERTIELSVLTNLETLSAKQKATKEVLEVLAVVDKSDKKTFLRYIGVFLSIGLLLIYYGFRKWHKEIQPKQDKLLDLEIKK